MSLIDDLDNELLQLLFRQQSGSPPDEEFGDGTNFMMDWGLGEHDILNDHDTEDFFNSIIGSFEDEANTISWSPLDSDSGISEDNNNNCTHEDSPSSSDVPLTDSPSFSEVVHSDHNYSLHQDSQTEVNCLLSVRTENPSTETDISIDLEEWEPDFVIENPQVIPVEERPGLVTLTIEDLQQNHKTNQHCFENLVLTDEEKRLLAKDGLELPTHLPLTKSEERALKRIRRKIRNKQSAQESRKKKKNYIDGLESRVVACTVQNQELQRKVQHLESQNMSLIEQLRKLQALVKQTTTKSANISTCIMVFLLSFTLIIFPSINPFGTKLGSQDESYSVLSRTLLDSESSHIRVVPKVYNPDANPDITEKNPDLDREIPQTLLSGSQNSTPEASDLAIKSTLNINSSSDLDRIVKPAVQDDTSLGRAASGNDKGGGYGISPSAVNTPNWTEHTATVIIKAHPRSDEM
ncbi:cAMP responsive element binding protein 3-like 3 like isoform X1 [Hemiscyllium ocellatum]|uniref:cAMP responsive element binding protein 3-like 3 like isoform X1 n=1 Tax=Hemiscyllium ocellatum TaxID=170820 RepID=UPI002966610B|nr:cAMP responsive element binding protein 3-like 3 like isoform X1 [Hemiscyllium ocellatum]XP_060713027.1 cAMP responsive element binding protein 3-like 3 like isoform X1 [Hemiscyllium ocellatum]